MLDYELLEQKEILKIVSDFRVKIINGILEEELIIKIKNFATKFKLEEKTVFNKIIEDDFFLLSFVKEPKKQSFHQNIAIEYIKNIKDVEEATLLPSSGINSLFIYEGNILTKGELEKIGFEKGKSIDFYWKVKNKDSFKFYATHKYTKQNGGSQDNQFNDIQHFLSNAVKSNNKNIFFIAICDGEYYQKKFKGFNTKIDYLNNYFKSENVFSTNINDLGSFINEITSKHKTHYI